MNKITVVFRAVKSGEFKGSIDCVFLDYPNIRFHRLACYTDIGQHGEGCIDYFYRDTRPCKVNEYTELLREVQSIYDDCEIIVLNKLPSKTKLLRGTL